MNDLKDRDIEVKTHLPNEDHLLERMSTSATNDHVLKKMSARLGFSAKNLLSDATFILRHSLWISWPLCSAGCIKRPARTVSTELLDLGIYHCFPHLII